MMYNPYNWTIKKNDDVEMRMDTIPGGMNPLKCILEEIGTVSNLIELKKIESVRLEKELKETIENF